MAARCGQAAGPLAGIGGPALVGGHWPLAPCARGLLAVEDELLGGLVDGGCAAEPGGAADSEVVQRALDVTGHIPGRPSASCRLGRRPSAARGETASGMDRGTRAGEYLAGRTDSHRDLGHSSSGTGTGGPRVTVAEEHLVNAAPWSKREWVRDVRFLGEAAGGHEQPAGTRGRAYLLFVGGGDLRQGLARVMGGRDNTGQITGLGGQRFGRADGLGRAALQGPYGVGVGQPPGPQRQVCCLGCGR